MTTTDLAIPDTDSVEVELAGRGVVMIPTAMIERFPALNPELDMADLLEDALGGGELKLSDLTKLKVPSAELKRLMVPDEDGEPQPVAELVGIPVAQTARRSWWSDPQPSGKAPECSSNDLIHGVGTYGPDSAENPSGLCENCPMAQQGSMTLIAPQRGETKASACKEQRLLFLLTDRELLPLMVIIPPGSLPNHKEFGVSLAKRGILGPTRPELGLNERGRAKRASQWLAVEVALTLEQKTNPAGQDYNMIKFKQVRKLTPGEQEVISVYGLYFDNMIAKQADSLTDVAAEAAGGSSSTARDGVIDVDDEDLIDDVDIPTGASSGR